MRALVLLFVLLTVLFGAPEIEAREYAPRVVSPHNADAYSMRTFRQFHRWRDLESDELAWEVYEYLVAERLPGDLSGRRADRHRALALQRASRDPAAWAGRKREDDTGCRDYAARERSASGLASYVKGLLGAKRCELDAHCR